MWKEGSSAGSPQQILVERATVRYFSEAWRTEGTHWIAAEPEIASFPSSLLETVGIPSYHWAWVWPEAARTHRTRRKWGPAAPRASPLPGSKPGDSHIPMAMTGTVKGHCSEREMSEWVQKEDNLFCLGASLAAPRGWRTNFPLCCACSTVQAKPPISRADLGT